MYLEGREFESEWDIIITLHWKKNLLCQTNAILMIKTFSLLSSKVGFSQWSEVLRLILYPPLRNLVKASTTNPSYLLFYGRIFTFNLINIAFVFSSELLHQHSKCNMRAHESNSLERNLLTTKLWGIVGYFQGKEQTITLF